MWRGVLAALTVGLSGVAASAADLPTEIDAGAPEGAVQTLRRDRQIDTYALPVARFGGSLPATETLTGRAIWSAYRLVTDKDVDELVQSYRGHLAGLDFAPVFDCATRTCGGFDFRFQASLLPAPGMLMDTSDFAQVSMRRGADDAAASVLISRVLDAIYIQTVVIIPGGEAAEVLPSGGGATALETVILPQDDKALYDTLIANGHVPVEGLDFEPGGATLSPSSDEALDMLARLLNRNEIAVVIVGHSDTVGGLEPNRTLSRNRAEAVRDALLKRGVSGDQLSAEGIAFLAPLTSNATEEGRARNRRVELVVNIQ